MSRGAGVRKADLDRAIAALADAGLGVARIEVRAGGVVWVVPTAPIASKAAPRADDQAAEDPAAPLTPEPPPAQPDELEGWRSRRANRAA